MNQNLEICNNPNYINEKMPVAHEKTQLYVEKNIEQQQNSNDVRYRISNRMNINGFSISFIVEF